MPSDTTSLRGVDSASVLPESTSSSRSSAAAYGFLGLFALLLGVMKFKHEMYLDEGQAWLIARDSNGILDLVHHLHYEGHPVLWYLLLYLPAHIFPKFMFLMQDIHYAIAMVTAWLLLTERRIPLVIRVLMVFGTSFFFSMGVLARSYMLAALLLIAAARCWQANPIRHWLGIGLLALAINTHFFAIPVAASIFVWCYWLSPMPSLAAAKAKLGERKFWLSVSILSSALIASYFTLRPAADVYVPNYEIPGANNVDYLVLGIGKVWTYFLPADSSLIGVPLMGASANLTVAAIFYMFLTIGLWILALAILPGARGRGLMICASLLWTAEVFLSVRIPLLSHSSFLIVSYAIALTLTNGDGMVRPWLPVYFAEPLLFGLFALQVSLCLYFCGQEWLYPFSGGKATAEWMASKQLLNRPLVVQPQIAAPAILGYTGEKSAYFPSCSCRGSFAVFQKDLGMRRQATREELDSVHREFGVSPLLISDTELSDGSLTLLRLHLVFTAPKGWAVGAEDVFVYDAVSAPALSTDGGSR